MKSQDRKTYFLENSGFRNPNLVEIKKDLTSKLHAPMIKNILIGNLQSSWSSSFFGFLNVIGFYILNC